MTIYDARMPQTIILTPPVREKFSRLADILQEASVLVRSLAKGDTVTLSENDPFWQDCDDIKEAFSRFSERQVIDLVDEAVTAVRRQLPS